MSKLNIRALSLKAVAGRVFKSIGGQQKKRRMVSAFKADRQVSNESISSLHSVIMSQSPSEQIDTLIDIDFQSILASWLYMNQVEASGLEGALSMRSQQQVVELIDVIVSDAAGPVQVMHQVLLLSQRILTCLYRMVDRSENAMLHAAYLNCISKIFRVKPDVFNMAIYAEMLAATVDKMDEFYEFMDYCLLRQDGQVQKWETVKLVLQGFSRRMCKFAERGGLIKGEAGGLAKGQRRVIVKAYIKLIDYLRAQVNSNLPERILNEHPEIFECLHSFASRSFEQHEISKVFNSLIAFYMGSRVSNVYKFSFILGIFKKVLAGSASVFSFLSTDALTNEDFLEWFFALEMTMERGREVLECYLKNSASLEFLLVMTIYYLSHFPQHTQSVASYMNWLGLLEEAKCFFHRDEIREYFQIYYTQIGEKEFFDDFVNRVEDRNHLLLE